MRTRHAAIAVALGFLALHLPFPPASLEDLDSMNFAIGLHDFDVAKHQPHPPGYPVYIAAARVVRAAIPGEAKALALVSQAAGALGLIALAALFAGLDRQWPRRWAALGALVVAVCPLYWFTAARPLSDVPGLAAALGIQALLLGGSGGGAVIAAAALSGVACGIRSQVAWLTLPLLAYVAVRHQGPRRVTFLATAAAAFVAGAAVWAVPLLIVSGGPLAYWRALFAQGAEDLTGIEMLWTRPTPRVLLRSLYFAFVAPWAIWPLAAGVLMFAAAGVPILYRAARTSLLIVALAFGPYLLFDVAFQETFTSRYALPLVIPVVYLAMRTVSVLPSTAGLALASAAAAFALAISTASVFTYSLMEAPAFRLLADMRAAPAVTRRPPIEPVLAMHRREDLDLRRPIQWVGGGMPRFSQRLAAPPKHEWLEMVTYWNAGGSAPVWFVADPQRTDLALIDHPAARHGTYRWPLLHPVLLGGVRPNEMDWHVFESPGWYLGQGWALTPETAGVAEEDRRGPGLAPIEGWIRRRREAVTLMVGGRNFMPAGAVAQMTVTVDGRAMPGVPAAPGFFLHFAELPAGALAGAGAYARITIAADQPRVAVEQFDAQSAGRVVFGFGDGWHEHEMEYTPATARAWRWMSERGVIRVRSAGRALRLVLTGTTERLDRDARISIRAGERVIGQWTLPSAFTVQAQIPAEAMTNRETEIVIESDQFFVPAERSRRTQDRRHLALRIASLQLTPAS